MSRDLESLRPRASMWVAVGIGSLLLHGGVAAGLSSYEPPPPPPVVVPVEVRVIEAPPPPPPKPPEPEKPPEPPPPEPPPEPEKPREAVKQKDPPPPPKKKPRRRKPKKPKPPKPDPAPPPAQPKADAPTEPPLMMGLEFEGLATSKTGVAVPQGAADGARDGAVDGTGRKGPRAPTEPGAGDAEETVPVAGVTTLPRLIREVKPDFPDALKRRGVEGKVVLTLEIGSDGRVRKARVVARLHPELDKLARRAALKLRFEPAKVRGTPVAVNLPYTFYFVID